MGFDINNYIVDLECKPELLDIMTVEHRSNNPKRDYLFCNKLQGKHIPVSPSKAFELFDMLVNEVQKSIGNKRVVVVGFAETATAIGAYMSSHLNNCVYHLQTSRENVNADKLIEFSEEHSHATEQYLYGELADIPQYDYILFVEDEISTGKTIRNFINQFTKINSNTEFGVASICNWQDSINKQIFADNGIDTFALLRGELRDVDAKMGVNTVKVGATKTMNGISIHQETVKIQKGKSVFNLERAGRQPKNKEYTDLIDRVATKVLGLPGMKEAQNILVMGTEEFMFIPMSVGYKLEQAGKNVLTHSTTRSGIDVIDTTSQDMHAGIRSKAKLHSAYDKDRITFIYNLAKYDKVVIIIDAKTTDEFRKDIVSALVYAGNNMSDISIINIK